MTTLNPSLDYLFQYPATNVLVNDDGSGYGIEFGGSGEGAGAIIGIVGEGLTPPEIAGKVLMTVIYSETETRLIFGIVNRDLTVTGQEEVSVAPDAYFIVDPRFNGEPFYPGKDNHADDPFQTIRDEFAGRFADGPDGPQELSQATEAPEGDEDTPEA